MLTLEGTICPDYMLALRLSVRPCDCPYPQIYFLWLFLGINHFRLVGLIFVCLFYDGNIQRLTESVFMEKTGIEPATPGLQDIGLSHTPRQPPWTLASYFELSSPTKNFYKFIVFKNQLRNKPHLHIKGANKLKMRFILKV